MKDFGLALVHGLGVFAFGLIGYFVLTVWTDAVASWITLGGAALMGLYVFIYSWVTEASATRHLPASRTR